ncbi:transcription termination factor MTEF1, chloroplastic [Diospyros lotus]|uniref:transcription termination factor MTEF1, chloroplastic n=1 Tax=Diospyros lotus TaxID=55363 RepID=UPI00224D308E|nr:transcription termination factor MTEF1, chloroplastic [Diospyros lotus]
MILISRQTRNASFPTLCSAKNPDSQPRRLRFPTSHRENLRYLKVIGVVAPATKTQSPESLTQILYTVNFFKSKAFSDHDFPRLAFVCPQLFSPTFCTSDLQPVFDFLTLDLAASVEQSRGLVLRFPRILFSDVQHCLRPTLVYLSELGLENLQVPTNLNAHLLNTRVHKLEEKIRFLRGVGFSDEESAMICARMPAIFGYSVEHNLRPKFGYLVREMRRGVEELLEFPQYFGFSLEKKIVPRHLHLQERGVRIPLRKMLLWSDQRFYAKWK